MRVSQYWVMSSSHHPFVILLGILLIRLSGVECASGDYPRDPSHDVPWDWRNWNNDLATIEQVFNDGRADDPTISASLNIARDFTQAEWNALSDNEKALYLCNRERVDRGIKPFAAVTSHVKDIAQDYADFLFEEGLFTHQPSSSQWTSSGRQSEACCSPWTRLDHDPDLRAGTEFFRFGENLAWSSSSSMSNAVEWSIYTWIYDDSSSNWGHRHFNLAELNDDSNDGMEGLIGFGITSGAAGRMPGTFVVMNAVDELSSFDYSSAVITSWSQLMGTAPPSPGLPPFPPPSPPPSPPSPPPPPELIIPVDVPPPTPPTAPPSPPNPAFSEQPPAPPASISMKVGQVAMFAPPKKTWSLGNGQDYELHLVADRITLVLVEFGPLENPINPRLYVVNEANVLGEEVALRDPSFLPQTAGDVDPNDRMDGEPYSTSAFSALLDRRFVQKGLVLTVRHDGGADVSFPVVVGAEVDFKLTIWGFYILGANESLVLRDKPQTKDTVTQMTPEKRLEYWSKMPFTTFQDVQHPGKAIFSPFICIGPRNGDKAYRAYHRDDFTSSLDPISIALKMNSVLQLNEGTKHMANHYYTSVIYDYGRAWGGLGGGHRGAGDSYFEGIFHHEQGHAFGLSHAGSAYDADAYPYKGGSLKGSDWLYDASRNEMNNVYINRGNSNFEDCRGDSAVQVDGSRSSSSTRCYKQNIMQGGSGEQDTGDLGLLADFSYAQIQMHFEGYLDARDGEDKESRVFPLVNAAGEYYDYKRWSYQAQKFIRAVPDKNNPAFEEFPVHFNIAVATVFVSLSCPELRCQNVEGPLENIATDITTVYQPLEYVGHVNHMYDLEDVVSLARVWRDEGPERGRCNRGCDFIVYVTFADGSTRKSLLPGGGFRAQGTTLKSGATDRYDGTSFDVVGATVPTFGSPVERVDLMYFPDAYKGMHAAVPQLITSYVKDVGEVKVSQGSGMDFTSSSFIDMNVITVEFTVQLPSGVQSCDIMLSTEFAHAIERSLFNVLTCHHGLDLPPYSKMNFKCMCIGESCPEGCNDPIPPAFPREGVEFRAKRRRSRTLLEDHAIADLEPSTSLRRNLLAVVEPECGCNFTSFDLATGQCLQGTHVSELTLDEYSEGVHYYRDRYGDKMAPLELGPLSSAGRGPSDSKSDSARVAREEYHDVKGFMYVSGSRTYLYQGKCVSPCFVTRDEHPTHPGLYWFTVDWTNPWNSAVNSATPVDKTKMRFKVDANIASKQSALRVYEKLGDLYSEVQLGGYLANDPDFQSAFPSAASANGLVRDLTRVGSVSGTLEDYTPTGSQCIPRASWVTPPSEMPEPDPVPPAPPPPPPSHPSPPPWIGASPPPGVFAPPGPSWNPIPSRQGDDPSTPPPISPPPADAFGIITASPPPSSSPAQSPPASNSEDLGAPPEDLGAPPDLPVVNVAAEEFPEGHVTGCILRATIIILGYVRRTFGAQEELSLQRALSTHLKETNGAAYPWDVHVVSVRDARTVPQTSSRRLLDSHTDVLVPGVSVEFEILYGTYDAANAAREELEKPHLLSTLRGDGLTSALGLVLDTDVSIGQAYTPRQSQMQKNLKTFGYPLISLSVLFCIAFPCVVLTWAMRRPQSPLARSLSFCLGEDMYDRMATAFAEYPGWFCGLNPPVDVMERNELRLIQRQEAEILLLERRHDAQRLQFQKTFLRSVTQTKRDGFVQVMKNMNPFGSSKSLRTGQQLTSQDFTAKNTYELHLAAEQA